MPIPNLDEQEVNDQMIKLPIQINYGQSINQPPHNIPNINIRSPVRPFHVLSLIHFGTNAFCRLVMHDKSSPNAKLASEIVLKTLIRLEFGLLAVTFIIHSERMLDFSCNTLNRWMSKLLQWQHWPNEINRLAVYFEEN